MYLKLSLIITIGFHAVEGDVNLNLLTDVVWIRGCIGVKGPSPSDVGRQILSKLKNLATNKQDEDIKRTPLLILDNLDGSLTQEDFTVKFSFNKRCIGIEFPVPIPKILYQKMKSKAKLKNPHLAVFGESEKNDEIAFENIPSAPGKPREVMIEWKDNGAVMPASAPRDFSETYATLNGYAADIGSVIKYINSLQSQRKMFDRWVEIENGAFKSELVDYPPDHLKVRLMKLIAIKEARDKRSHSNQEKN